MAAYRRSTIAPRLQMATRCMCRYIAFSLLWRPTRHDRRRGGRCRVCVCVCVVASAICCGAIAFFSTSLAFSGFLLCAALRPLPTAPLGLSLSSLLPQSRGPWALFAAAGLSFPSVARAQRPQKPLATRSALHLDRAGGRAGQRQRQRQLASLVRRSGPQDIVDNLILDFLPSHSCRGPCFICRLELIWSECHNWNFAPKN